MHWFLVTSRLSGKNYDVMLAGGAENQCVQSPAPSLCDHGDAAWSPTSKTSSSSILVPNTTIPLVSMMGLALRSSLWVVLFLQSRMRVMVCLCTLMATRCHLERKEQFIHSSRR